MKKIICSACLLGVKCRYDGKIKPNKKVLKLSKTTFLIPVCPEQLGGQSTPRPNAEIVGGEGKDVLQGRAKVIEFNGQNVTRHFINGAKEVLKLARRLEIKEAILKQGSPSCGCGLTYDGSFTDRKIKGDGVTVALLKKNKIKVIPDDEL
ncbi:MAG: DUF523 domain-containing protein [Patescibacteria group bacterium]